jgi:hypothetical protein
MGPELVNSAKAGRFDEVAWTAAERAAAGRTFDEAVDAIAAQKDVYPALLNDLTEADLRAEIAPFGFPTSRGAFLVNLVLCGCAAYRTQLFIYLKACGREELGTMNLWGGMDDPAAT